MGATEHRDLEQLTAADLAVERFDAAEDAYRRVLENAPVEALGQRRPGDDYTLAGLAYHVNAVLAHYHATARAMLDAGLRAASAPDSSELFKAANAKAGGTPTGAERDTALAETVDLHRAIRDLLAGVDTRDWGRTVPVRFGSGDPHPTRLLDVLGWLTDHYVEHTAQVASLLADWQTLAVHDAIDRALAARDVDAYLACLAEDIVFENTTPAPDGERMIGPAIVAFFKQFFVSTPSARFTTEEAFAAGDRAVVRWRFDWDEGPDNRGHVRGVDVLRVSGGRVTEMRSYVKG